MLTVIANTRVERERVHENASEKENKTAYLKLQYGTIFG